MDRPKKILTIDGGGLCGVFAAAIIEQMEEAAGRRARGIFDCFYDTSTGAILDSCTADYDGDGVDEIVLMEHFGIWNPCLLYIGDPSSKRPYVQALNLWTNMRYNSPYVFHGTKGDFNGDGLLDLVLSYSRGENNKEVGYFTLFLGNREDGPSNAALRRVY